MSSGWKQTAASEGRDAMVFFGNLISFFKTHGDKAAVGTFQRDRVVSASGDVTPDGGKKRSAGVSGGGFFCRDAHGSKTSNYISLNPVSDSFFLKQASIL